MSSDYQQSNEKLAAQGEAVARQERPARQAFVALECLVIDGEGRPI